MVPAGLRPGAGIGVRPLLSEAVIRRAEAGRCTLSRSIGRWTGLPRFIPVRPDFATNRARHEPATQNVRPQRHRELLVCSTSLHKDDVRKLSTAADRHGQTPDVDERLPRARTCQSSGPSKALPQSRSSQGQLIEARLSAAMISRDNPPIPAIVRMTCQRHQSSRSCIQSIGGAVADQVITIALIG